MPIDSIQAASGLIAMKQAGCTKVAIANDKEAYGAGLATLLELEKGYYGVNIVSNTGIDPTAPNFRSYASTIQGQGADCFYFAGIVSNGAVQITKDVNSALPKAKIFGGDGVCTDSYTSAAKGGVPASIYPLMECTVATLDLAAYPGGKDFLAAYKAKYGTSNPDPYAIYGYEVMKLGLDTIASLGAQGNSKSAVLKALFATTARNVGARRLRVRQERRHDAEVLRPVQGRDQRRAALPQDDHAHQDPPGLGKSWRGRTAPPPRPLGCIDTRPLRHMGPTSPGNPWKPQRFRPAHRRRWRHARSRRSAAISAAGV